MKFAKGGEQNYCTEILRIAKVIEGRPLPIFKLEDLNRTPIDGQIYHKELTPVRVTRSTVYKIDKILDERVSRGFENIWFVGEVIRETLIRGS